MEVTPDGIASLARVALEFLQGNYGGFLFLGAIAGVLALLVIRGKRKETEQRGAQIQVLTERIDKCESRHQECEDRVGKIGLALYHLLHDTRKTQAKRMAKEAIQDLLEDGA